MEVYTLDSLYRPENVIDVFESLIWTERFIEMGDFELALHSTRANRKLLTAGTRLAVTESKRVMEVETIEDSNDSEGRKILKVKGRGLEKILEDRIARPSLDNLTTTPKWVLTGAPAALMRKIFHDICVLGVLDPGDIIPGITEGSIFPADTIAEPSETVTVEVDPTTVYKATKDLGDVYDLGFRLVRDPNTSQLYYDIYAGSDRTTSQSTLDPVIFSPDLENLQDTSELTTIALAKNVALVLSPVGHEWVYPFGVDPTVAGFERRALLVKADDIQDTDPAIASAKMIQKGKEELAKYRALSAFDGEISQNSAYKYGLHYNLGDLVEQRNTDGVTNQMRVTEQIFVSDKEGDRSYPTLSISKFITPGSWSAWDFNQTWLDLDPSPETWADQP